MKLGILKAQKLFGPKDVKNGRNWGHKGVETQLEMQWSSSGKLRKILENH